MFWKDLRKSKNRVHFFSLAVFFSKRAFLKISIRIVAIYSLYLVLGVDDFPDSLHG